MQMNQAMQGMLNNIQKSIEAQQAENEKNRVANEHFKADVEAYNANTQRLKAILDSLSKATGPDGTSAVLNQTIREILQSPSLEMEEPVALERGELHTQLGVQ